MEYKLRQLMPVSYTHLSSALSSAKDSCFFTRKRLHAAFYAQRIFHRFQDRTNMRGIARRGDDEILRYIHQLPHLKHHDIGRLMLIS